MENTGTSEKSVTIRQSSRLPVLAVNDLVVRKTGVSHYKEATRFIFANCHVPRFIV